MLSNHVETVQNGLESVHARDGETVTDFSFFGYMKFSKIFQLYREILWTKYMEFSKFMLLCLSTRLHIVITNNQLQSHTNTFGFFKFWVLGIFNFSKLYREILWTEYQEISIFSVQGNFVDQVLGIFNFLIFCLSTRVKVVITNSPPSISY